MAAGERLLIVNADDFGFTRDVNEGIVQAHQRGILTAATVMANGAAFDHAAELARKVPTLDVGCHLVLVGGTSVLPPYGPLPADVKALLAALAAGRISIAAELEAQVRRIVEAGLRPSHLDTHKHTHLLPPVLKVVARLGARYGIPWVRRPFDFPRNAGEAPWGRRVLSGALGVLRPRFHRVLHAHGCRTTDHFAGFSLTGYLQTRELVDLLHSLPEGRTEFMTHPGVCTDELRHARTRLKEERERELEALTSPEAREALEAGGIRLVNYRDLT